MPIPAVKRTRDEVEAQRNELVGGKRTREVDIKPDEKAAKNNDAKATERGAADGLSKAITATTKAAAAPSKAACTAAKAAVAPSNTGKAGLSALPSDGSPEPSGKDRLSAVAVHTKQLNTKDAVAPSKAAGIAAKAPAIKSAPDKVVPVAAAAKSADGTQADIKRAKIQ
jgi:hypothetical protein